jgi:ADP-ribose pyrophosphatase YjhB (NUDIX family)
MVKKIIKIIWENLNPATRVRIVRSTQKKFTVSAAAVVVNETGEVLLLNHVLRADLSWGIPGGFIANGEQPEAAVRREIREETGLELENIKLIRVRTMNRHIEILFRASPVGTARVQSLEINELGWFKVNEMPDKMSHIQKQMIEKVLNSEYTVLAD